MAPDVGLRAAATGGSELTVSLPHPVMPTNSKAAKNPVRPSLRVRVCMCIPHVVNTRWAIWRDANVTGISSNVVTNGDYPDATLLQCSCLAQKVIRISGVSGFFCASEDEANWYRRSRRAHWLWSGRTLTRIPLSKQRHKHIQRTLRTCGRTQDCSSIDASELNRMKNAQTARGVTFGEERPKSAEKKQAPWTAAEAIIWRSHKASEINNRLQAPDRIQQYHQMCARTHIIRKTTAQIGSGFEQMRRDPIFQRAMVTNSET